MRDMAYRRNLHYTYNVLDTRIERFHRTTECVGEVGVDSSGLADTVYRFRSHKCFDPRDKVYAVLGLVHWSPIQQEIEPDYSLQPLGLFDLLRASNHLHEYHAPDMQAALGLGGEQCRAELKWNEKKEWFLVTPPPGIRLGCGWHQWI